LERKLFEFEVGLSHTDGPPCGSEPSAEEVGRVQQVIRASEAEDYWYYASMDGNREDHYRGRLPPNA